METMKFTTNIKCNGCIMKVTPSLNNIKGIVKWEVDLNDPMKMLTVESTDASANEVIQALEKSGYKAEFIAG
jgi:copper chaperone